MLFRSVKRHNTPFGVMIHKRGPVGSNLLITKHGRNLGLRHGAKLGSLLKSVHVDRKDNVTFGENVHPLEIGHGVHAKVFRVFPREEAQFVEAMVQGVHLPSVILKVYRESVSRKEKPDGFTQFFANSFVFNYLKNLSAKTFEIRSLSTFFVSEKLLVRKYINAPTLEEAFIALMRGKQGSERLSEALSNKQIYRFLEKNRITKPEVEVLDAELLAAITIGARTGFGTNFKIVPDFAHMRNAFILGRAKNGKLIVAVIDQGKETIKGLADRIRKGKIF